MRWRTMIGPLLMLSLVTTASCTRKVVPSVPANDATVQCTVDCWSVSKAFVKEHAALFNEVIRLREALDTCNKKLR